MTKAEKVEILENTLKLWLDIVKNEHRYKTHSKYFDLVRTYPGQCGLCELYASEENHYIYLSCNRKCPLKGDDYWSCKYYDILLIDHTSVNIIDGWHNFDVPQEQRTMYARRIAWSIRRHLREVEKC